MCNLSFYSRFLLDGNSCSLRTWHSHSSPLLLLLVKLRDIVSIAKAEIIESEKKKLLKYWQDALVFPINANRAGKLLPSVVRWCDNGAIWYQNLWASQKEPTLHYLSFTIRLTAAFATQLSLIFGTDVES